MTNEEFDEILERTNAVVCNREWYERAAKALEQEEYYKDLAQSYERTIVKLKEAIAERQPSEDCVSRQAVLAGINDWWGITLAAGEPSICDYIRELPPVTPTHIETVTEFADRCRECGREKVLDKIRAEIEQNAYPIVHGVNNHEKGMTLYGILQIIDKYKAESEG